MCVVDDQNDGVFTFSFDATFGLVRKKNSGVSTEPPKHNSFFMPRAVVDTNSW